MAPNKHSLLLFMALLLFSCGSTKEQADDAASSSEADTSSIDEGNSKGKVTEAELKDHSHLDGCQFMLITPEDKKLYPLNLDTAYHEDGLKVRVRYRKKDAMTTCMAGTNVKVLEIERLE